MLGDEMRPVPDVTTHSGRRMYYSHIDGDGWRNVTLVKPYKKDKAYSSRGGDGGSDQGLSGSAGYGGTHRG